MQRSRLQLAAVVAMLLTSGGADSQPREATSLALEGDHLMATLADGSTISGDRLIGLEVPIEDSSWRLRIDNVQPDDLARRPGALVYDVSVQEGGNTWQKLCPPDPYARTSAIAVPGRFEADPTSFVPGTPGSFTFACTAEPAGKCIRFGYPPWLKTAGGTDLGPYHAACVRMMQADYCGDSGRVVPEVPLQIFDSAGVNRPRGALYGEFEAVWGEDGALCVAKGRAPRFPLAQILEACPHLAETSGEACTLEGLKGLPGALLANRS